MIIYIPLLNEGARCWRPVEAEHLEGDTYRIIQTKPPDEQWPVATGDVVRGEHRRFSDGFQGLVAIIPETDLPLPIS